MKEVFIIDGDRNGNGTYYYNDGGKYVGNWVMIQKWTRYINIPEWRSI